MLITDRQNTTKDHDNLHKTNEIPSIKIKDLKYSNTIAKKNEDNSESFTKINKEYKPHNTDVSDNTSIREINLLKFEYTNIIRDWKEKFYNLSNENENVKISLFQEKQKFLEFDKLRNLYEEINKEVFALKNQLTGAYDEKDQFMFKYHQSETIRIEQSRLIQSLNKDVEKLSKMNSEIDKSIEKEKENKDEKSTKDKKITKKKKQLNVKSKSVVKTKK